MYKTLVDDDVKLKALSYLPDSYRGKLLVDDYLDSLRRGNEDSGKSLLKDMFARRALRMPGSVYNMAKYLNGNGRHLIPEIVARNLGDHWYTSLAKKFSGTPIGHNLFMQQFLEKTLPTINGDNGLARQIINAGGML